MTDESAGAQMVPKLLPPEGTPVGTVCVIRMPNDKLSLPPQPVYAEWVWLGRDWAPGEGQYPMHAGAAYLFGYRFHAIARATGPTP